MSTDFTAEFAECASPAEANEVHRRLFIQEQARLGRPNLSFSESFAVSEPHRKCMERLVQARVAVEKAAEAAAERAERIYTCSCGNEFTQPADHVGRGFTRCDDCRAPKAAPKAEAKPKPVKPAKPTTNHNRTCVKCGAGFVTVPKRGRPAVKCETCR